MWKKGLVDTVAMDIKKFARRLRPHGGGTGLDLAPIRERGVFAGRRGRLRAAHHGGGGLYTETDFVAIGEWLAGAKRYFLQRFVDSGDVLERGFGARRRGDAAVFGRAAKKHPGGAHPGRVSWRAAGKAAEKQFCANDFNF